MPKGTGDLPVNEWTTKPPSDSSRKPWTPACADPNRNLDKPELDKPAYGGGH